MTFNVDYTGIANWESVVTAPDGNLCAATLALQWAMLPMGYNRITAATVEDVVMRFRVWKALIGEPTAYMNGEPYWPTVDDVIRHIGLQSNATPMTWPQFMKHAVAESIGTSRKELKRELALLAGDGCLCADLGDDVHSCISRSGRPVFKR